MFFLKTFRSKNWTNSIEQSNEIGKKKKFRILWLGVWEKITETYKIL